MVKVTKHSKYIPLKDVHNAVGFILAPSNTQTILYGTDEFTIDGKSYTLPQLVIKKVTENSIDITMSYFFMKELLKSHTQKYHTEISIGY